MADYREAERLYEAIANSHQLEQFQAAFEAATGLVLQIFPDSPDFSPSEDERANPFCRTLNEHNRCPECASAVHCVVSEARDKPKAFECFAHLSETAVPVLAGQVPVAFLTTGQIFTQEVGDEEWAGVESLLLARGSSEEELLSLRSAWLETRRIEPDQYRGMVALLSVFAGHLSELASKLVIQERQSEPDVVVRARQYVSAHLADRIELGDVAKHVAMSVHHFCRVFKQATGLTFKQYLTRRRVEWAKCRLRKPDARITEIAYDVGFGSLSQFNRSFQQVVGSNPTEWRQREIAKLTLPS